MFLCGTDQKITSFKSFVQKRVGRHLTFKDCRSKSQCFTRMLVKIKKEIISMGNDNVVVHEDQDTNPPHLDPLTLKKWYETKKDFIILDTRNTYEVSLGTFANSENVKSLHLDIETFRDFDAGLEQIALQKDKPIVTFCTGGIRCEKAAPLMRLKGYEQVFQLDGGILNYFKKCGGQFWNGDCYVFDKRVALNPELEETGHTMCFGCRHPISQFELLQQREEAKDGKCPFC
ncbi:unnamed protein product, partial [Heterosigma akashiwo]